MTDDELVSLARQGDSGAFDQLVVRHQVAVFRVAMAALRNAEEAEEGAQDVFVRAQTSSAISDRKMRVEVTAAILK